MNPVSFFFFFFQAEDGIRDHCVTGVQTCALPLYGMDAKLQVQRQMVEAEEVSPDGLTWTFRLRPGLKFHDGEPMLARDVVASINRWAAREPMGQMIKAIENELTAVDDRTFRWSLKKPYPKMLLALGKISAPCC